MTPSPGVHAATSFHRGLHWWGGSLATLAAAVYLAAHHPLEPGAAIGLVLVWVWAALRWRGLYLTALPAALPLLNLSPWTGWIGVEEFDMAVLGAAAGGYARIALDGRPSPPPWSGRGRLALGAVAVLSAIGLWRGVSDAGGLPLGWFQGYTEPLNAWRVSKSWVFALLMLPMLRRDWGMDRDAAWRRLALGMVTGAVLVTLAVLRERAAYPGLFDISARYRTTAHFWEMHVGGAAIDAYVVACTPFVVWALQAARSRWQWVLAAVFSLLWAYVGLTTFARGAYLGVAAGLLALGVLLPPEGTRSRRLTRALSTMIGASLILGIALESWGYPAAVLAFAVLLLAAWWRWRARRGKESRRGLALSVLALTLVFEAVVLVGPDSFMRQRVAGSSLDYEGRRTHWMRGLGLLDGTADWLWGIGLGRLPARYDRHAPRGEFPGTVSWHDDGTATFARITGPRTRSGQRGLYGLTQRVPIQAGYRLRLDIRPAGAVVWASVCESHLLYNRNCQATVVTASRAGSAWQGVEVSLSGPALDAGGAYAPRGAVMTLAVLGAGRSAEIDNVSLSSTDGRPLLENGGFGERLAQWLPSAQGHFVPWHIDNMYLEALIERGMVGLLFVLAMLVGAASRVIRRSADGDAPAAYAGASLAGLCVVGLVSSVFDVPRVAWLGLILMNTVVQAPDTRSCLAHRGPR